MASRLDNFSYPKGKKIGFHRQPYLQFLLMGGFFAEMVPCGRLDRAKARGTLNSTTDRWACRHGTKHLEVDMASTLALGSLQ